MLQKILIAFVTLMLAACLLTGCGEKDNDSNTATTDTATQAATVTDEKSTASEVELKPSKSGAKDNKRFGTGSDTSSDSGQSGSNGSQSNQQSGGNSGSGSQSQSDAGSSQSGSSSQSSQGGSGSSGGSQGGSSSKQQGGSGGSQGGSSAPVEKPTYGEYELPVVVD